jgi:hypothetical protein
MEMAHQKNFRIRIKLWLCFVTAATLLGLGSPPAMTTALWQEEDDESRRLWNKQFLAAREKAKKPKPAVKIQTAEAKPPAPVKPEAKPGAVQPGAVGGEAADGELIGVTIWRLRAAAAGDDRILVQKKGSTSSQYVLERVTADTPFSEGQLVRISVEAPREDDNYLYVIDREVYKDDGGERLGEPYLIFPAGATPAAGNVITAGKSIYVPAQGDPIPYFTLQRSGRNHIGERLTIIISPEPLPVSVEQPTLDPAMVAQWERQWGGPTEWRESRGDVGKQWTEAEQEADKSERKLVQSDPLPQTIYRIRAKPGGRVLVTIPLRIAP